MSMTGDTTPCIHGRPVTHVAVVDQTLKTEHNEYGDLEIPLRVADLDKMVQLRDAETGLHPDEPGRFVLAFIHFGCCRTEEIR